jgi:ABC-2 type transport system ATP-binding protein
LLGCISIPSSVIAPHKERPQFMELTVRSLSKKYSSTVWGLADLSLELKPGVLGLLGPNGAGKSTLMRILATVTRPSGGSVHWNGLDILSGPDPLRAVLGYLPQDFGIYPHLTAIEFLEYLAAVKGLDGRMARRRIDELLAMLNLSEARHRPLGGFSGGMRQRVGIAQALLNDPKLLIVDEPTAGLDPEERVRFRNLLSELSGERIVILSTHIVSDVEAVATSIAILGHGRLLAHDSPESLLTALSGKVWEIVVPSDALPSVQKQYLVTSSAHRSDGVHVRVVAESAPLAQAISLVPTLEDAYLATIALERRAPAGAAA